MAKKPTTLQRAIREQLAEQARLEAIGVVGFKRVQPKLNPGSLSMPTAEPRNGDDEVDAELLEVIRNARPPWHGEAASEFVDDDWEPPAEEPVNQPTKEDVAAALKKYKAAQSKMRAARREAEALKPAVRDEAFEYWIRRYVVIADARAEWTLSSVLYENYCAHAGEQAVNRSDKAVMKLEPVSHTRFGLLLRKAGFASERRSRPDGNHYPLRLKQGA